MTYRHEDEFWKFINEREAIRLRRWRGLPREEWTTDPIFKQFSFTNVKRIDDRTTSLLYQEFYTPFQVGHQDDQGYVDHPCMEALLNAAIFRFHGTIETARVLGWSSTWQGEDWLVRKTDLMMRAGERVFTPAYIIPNCGDSRAKTHVVAGILGQMIEHIPHIINTIKWQTACERLCDCYGIGPFMAKEILLDYILATEWVPDDWESWTPVGPGGLKGAGFVRYGHKPKSIPTAEALEIIQGLYSRAKTRWEHTSRHLDLTDIQFQLCELAKYKRYELGFGRPKRKFSPTIDAITKR